MQRSIAETSSGKPGLWIANRLGNSSSLIFKGLATSVGVPDGFSPIDSFQGPDPAGPLATLEVFALFVFFTAPVSFLHNSQRSQVLVAKSRINHLNGRKRVYAPSIIRIGKGVRVRSNRRDPVERCKTDGNPGQNTLS